MPEKFCKNCKHYRESDAKGREPPIGFCGSAQAKTLMHPIGFLAPDARACDLFQLTVIPGDLARTLIRRKTNQFCSVAGL